MPYSTVGPTTPNSTVKLRLRAAQGDITSARVRVWNDRTNTQTYYSMAWDGGFDSDPTTYDWWFADIPVGAQPTILYYFFELNDQGSGCTADQDFYVDDDIKFYGGGTGAISDNYDDTRSFQITVYDPAFGTLADFQSMAAAANSHGIKIVLDGVFNHVASDSKYFDRYSRYDAAGNLTSPSGVGANDGSGACEATGSAFRSWFYMP